MTLRSDAGAAPVRPHAQPAWGELASSGETASVLRLCTPGRTVSFPSSLLRRWELAQEHTLTLLAGDETVTIEGRDLSAVRDALDAQRLHLLRVTHGRPFPQSGTHVTAITFAVENP